ncbi:MAG: hypothetical protein D3906_08245 [Candidatus Electrothrix sp. AUS1_2]|nr:hypothetical protein [Candidatus Electrothrix sp. AUS1_2]
MNIIRPNRKIPPFLHADNIRQRAGKDEAGLWSTGKGRQERQKKREGRKRALFYRMAAFEST